MATHVTYYNTDSTTITYDPGASNSDTWTYDGTVHHTDKEIRVELRHNEHLDTEFDFESFPDEKQETQDVSQENEWISLPKRSFCRDKLRRPLSNMRARALP